MKRKVLSIVVSAAMVLSQATGFAPAVRAYAAENSVVESIINEINADIVVDKNYSGTDGEDVNGIPTYKTVQAAINSVSTSNTEEVKVFIKNGTYREKLTIASPYITLIGQSAEKTVLTFDDAAGTIKRTEDGGDGTATYGTSSSSSITIKSAAKGFCAANLTMSNSFDEEAHPEVGKGTQAVAVKVEADESIFVNCKFLGNQDTLYPNKNKQYFYNCYIEGDVDFIFGAATSVFEDCEMKSVDREGISPKGYVAAPSTTEETKYGFLFLDSKLTSNITEAGSVYLGRPWHPSSTKVPVVSNAVYVNCDMGAHINEAGWTEMSCAGVMVQPLDNDMFEYGSTGEGAVENENRRILTDDQLEEYSKESYLQGWDPSDKVDELSSYEENTDMDEDSETEVPGTTPGEGNGENGGNTGSGTENPVEDSDWHFTRFGVTTSPENNTIDIDKENNTVTITSGQADGTNAGGKVTGSNDGLSYYYTEIDPSENFEISADVKVNFFEKAKPDKQCAFGIIARDTLGAADDVSVSPSNMILVGGYKAMVQSVFRNGVTPDLSDKIVMENAHTFDSTRPAAGSTYKLTLKKTNTGYIASVNDGEEVTYYRPKQLEVVDGNKIYVGFATARIASITVSDIKLTKTKAANDPAGVPEPVAPIAPALGITSPSVTSSTKYDLKLNTTVKGNVNVELNGNEVYDKDVNGDVTIPTTLNVGDNTFNITYTPEGSAAPIVKTFTVNTKSYGVENGTLYVSQDGSADGDGTIENPLDIYTAVKYTNNGQTIKVKGGTYNLTQPITIDYGNNGTAKNMKTLEGYDGRAIFNFGSVSKGMFLNGDYWNIRNIDITKTLDANAGFRIAGNHNVIENVKAYENGDTGIQISAPSQEADRSIWPSYNSIINCDSYDNMDSAMNNADGFAAKITCGPGNTFKGCVAHNNCDDGWDLFSKLEVGGINAVTIDGCIAYGNGTLSTGVKTKGDGNGFKLGGEGIPVAHTLLNSLSFNNDADGITGNSNPAARVENSTSVDNKETNFMLDYYTNAVLKYVFKNTVSFRTDGVGENDSVPDFVKGKGCYFFDGTESSDSTGKVLTADMFKSTEAPTSIERDENNDIIWTDYMVPVKSSSSSSGSSGSHHHSSGSIIDNIVNDVHEIIKDAWVKLHDKWYHTDSEGKNQTGWHKFDGKWYYFAQDGSMQTGWMKLNEKWYHLNESGDMSTGWFKDANNAWYLLNASGEMQTGWAKDYTGMWYFLNAGGDMKTGWHHDNDGNWYFLKASGAMAFNETVDGYYVNNSGAWVK